MDVILVFQVTLNHGSLSFLIYVLRLMLISLGKIKFPFALKTLLGHDNACSLNSFPAFTYHDSGTELFLGNNVIKASKMQHLRRCPGSPMTMYPIIIVYITCFRILTAVAHGAKPRIYLRFFLCTGDLFLEKVLGSLGAMLVSVGL